MNECYNMLIFTLLVIGVFGLGIIIGHFFWRD
jgi:hypothetical protein